MEKLELLRRWLQEWTGSQGLALQVDYLGKMPMQAALVGKGRKLLQRRQDVLGGASERWEERFAIRARLLAGAERDGGANAALWRGLQDWCRDNPPPALGLRQTAQLEQAALEHMDGDGTAVYGAVLVVEYTLE